MFLPRWFTFLFIFSLEYLDIWIAIHGNGGGCYTSYVAIMSATRGLFQAGWVEPFEMHQQEHLKAREFL